MKNASCHLTFWDVLYPLNCVCLKFFYPLSCIFPVSFVGWLCNGFIDLHQHVLEWGKPYERSQIISKLSGHIVQLSQHKFASNVIKKCLEYGGPTERELLIGEIFGHNEGTNNLLVS